MATVFRDVLDFSEISFRQTDLTEDEERRVRQLLAHWIDDAFDVVIRVVREIDWSRNPKRLLFINDLSRDPLIAKGLKRRLFGFQDQVRTAICDRGRDRRRERLACPQFLHSLQ